MEACQRIIALEEEVGKMNEVIDEYKKEIGNWSRRMGELQSRNQEDLLKLRAQFDGQKNEWLEREMYEANRKHLSEKNQVEFQA